jgi:hypothetical protein
MQFSLLRLFLGVTAVALLAATARIAPIRGIAASVFAFWGTLLFYSGRRRFLSLPLGGEAENCRGTNEAIGALWILLSIPMFMTVAGLIVASLLGVPR